VHRGGVIVIAVIVAIWLWKGEKFGRVTNDLSGRPILKPPDMRLTGFLNEKPQDPAVLAEYRGAADLSGLLPIDVDGFPSLARVQFMGHLDCEAPRFVVLPFPTWRYR
jgi:hypothetical protein